MADTINIITSEFDTFQVERTFLDAAGEPRAVISGVLCNIDTKPGLLAAGLAFCQPLDPALMEDWPVYTDVEVNGIPDRWWNITNDPALVKAAREKLSMAKQES
jgi:hypothetical protein